MVGVVVFFLAGAACVALYLAISPQSRAVDERFADLAVKMRASQGALAGDLQDDNVLRMLFRWAAKRVPPPNLDTPTGEKLQQTLAQAGFLKSSAPQTYQVTRVLMAVGGGLLGLLVGAIFHSFGGHAAAARNRRRRHWNFRAQLLPGTARAAAPGQHRKAALGRARSAGGMRRSGHGTVRGDSNRRHGMRTSWAGNRHRAEPGRNRYFRGRVLGQALRGLADRTAVEDIKPLAATLIQSEQLGAQIGPALRASSDALRTRRRLHAEEDAQKASIKILFPLVIFVLPSMIAVIIGPAMISVFAHVSRVEDDSGPARPRPSRAIPIASPRGPRTRRAGASVRGLFV